MNFSTPGFPVLHSRLEFVHAHIHRVGDAIQPCHPCRPLLLLLSVFPGIRVFSSELALRISWPKYWSFGFSISPSDEYFDWFSLLLCPRESQESSPASQFKSINSLLLKLLLIQLSCLDMTYGKTVALTIWTFLSKLLSLLFSMLSRFVITFLPGSKCLLISRL